MSESQENEIAQERMITLKVYRREVKDLDTRFAPGTVGWHELWDRLHVQHVNWETHVASHPAIVLDAKTFSLARQIANLMVELYAHVGVLGDGKDAEPIPNTD